MTLQEWVDQLAAELGVPPEVGTDDLIDVLLDTARDAAHNVARPAAPLTTFLVGYAAAARGGGPDAVRAAADQAVRLALGEADEPPAPSAHGGAAADVTGSADERST